MLSRGRTSITPRRWIAWLARVASAAALICGVASACGVSRPWEATPTPVPGLPERSVADSLMAAEEEEAPGCRTHLWDPRDRTALILVRSIALAPSAHWGDYTVTPPGRYGLGPDRLLRIDCATRRPLGAVPGD